MGEQFNYKKCKLASMKEGAKTTDTNKPSDRVRVGYKQILLPKLFELEKLHFSFNYWHDSVNS